MVEGAEVQDADQWPYAGHAVILWRRGAVDSISEVALTTELGITMYSSFSRYSLREMRHASAFH